MRDQSRGEARFFVNGASGAAALSAVMALCIARPAVAITINPVYDSSITSLSNAASIESAFNTVAGDYARSFTGNAVIDVGVIWGSVDGYSLPSNAVGASVDNLYGYFSYSNI